MPSDPHLLSNFREIWERKPILRTIYNDFYRRILENIVAGATLEIGGGSGNLKAFAPNVVSSDIIYAPWLDIVCDAQRMPFASGSISNVVMIDVLHHVENPIYALTEIKRVLRPGGRLVFCEPAITPISSAFYRFFHPEPVDMSANPLAAGAISPDKDPFDSNQAYPTLLVGRFRDAVAQQIPELELVNVDRFSFLAYPLSGGFRPWSLMPDKLAKPLLAAEWSLRGVLGRLAAFRLLAVYQRRPEP
jgi:SAM-dependent methyltransferase